MCSALGPTPLHQGVHPTLRRAPRTPAHPPQIAACLPPCTAVYTLHVDVVPPSFFFAVILGKLDGYAPMHYKRAFLTPGWDFHETNRSALKRKRLHIILKK